MRLRTWLLLSTVLLLIAGVVATVASTGASRTSPLAEPPVAELPPAVTAPPEEPGEETSPAPASPPAPEPPPVPADRAELTARLTDVVRDPLLAVSEGVVAVTVLDGWGREVLSHRGEEALLPASTMKLVTAATALQTFGPDHRFTTAVRTGQPVTDGGTVIGDLVLVGSGDPVLGTPAYGELVYPARPRTRLEDLADRIVASGVERVTGAVVGDGTAFGTETTARGWKDNYLSDLDARHISSLTVDAGISYDLNDDPRRLIAEIRSDPAELAAAALWRMLVERGVTVEAGSRSADTPPLVEHTVAEVESPPLDAILAHMVQRSDNQVADTLFRTVSSTTSGMGGWNGGALAARGALGALGVDGRDTVFADGSGLSREDRLSTDVLAQLDQAMTASEHAGTWGELMAVAGQEGTLRRRLRGTLAEGRFLGKTGTLDDVKSVAGTIVGPGPERYHLAVIGNDVSGRDKTTLRVLMDELVLALGEDLFGCARGPVPQPTPSPGATPSPSASPSPAPTPPYVAPYALRCPGGAIPAPAEPGSAAASLVRAG